MVPIAIGLLHFSAKDAIAIAAAIVTESAFIRFIFFSAHAKHPERHECTEIDYNLVKLIFPVFLVGSYFGVIFSVSLGELPLAILIMLLLTFLTFQVLYQAINRFKKESAQLKKARPAELEMSSGTYSVQRT